MHFTLKQLTYFVAAGESGSITKASERINVSQPSVSAAIAQLEASFEIQLFVRHHAQGLSLTPAGQRFLRETRQLLAHADELRLVAAELSDRVAGTLGVGCLVPLAPIIIPELCHSFVSEHGSVHIDTHEGNQADILDMLRKGTIGLALTYDLYLSEDIAFQPLAKLPPNALLPASHKLASRKSLRLSALAEEPFILLDLPLSREYFTSMFLQDGLKPNITTRTRYPEVVRGLVARGYGYSLINVRPSNRAALDGSPLAYVALNRDYPTLTLGVATLAGSRRTRAVDAFVDHCRSRVTDRQVPGMT